MGGMIMTPEEYIDQMKIQEVSWNGDICEKLFRGFLLKAFLKSASNEPFDQEGEFKKLMDKI